MGGMLSLFDTKYSGELAGFSLIALIPLALLHIVLAMFVRCPECNKCLTIQIGRGVSSTKASWLLSGWGFVVAKWFSGKVVCMHCGVEVNTNAL